MMSEVAGSEFGQAWRWSWNYTGEWSHNDFHSAPLHSSLEPCLLDPPIETDHLTNITRLV